VVCGYVGIWGERSGGRLEGMVLRRVEGCVRVKEFAAAFTVKVCCKQKTFVLIRLVFGQSSPEQAILSLI
jgi:hypothetical protein